MRHGLWYATILSFIVIQSAAIAQETKPRPKGFKALDHFVGSWTSTGTNKVVPDIKTTGKESTAWILKERYILGRESSQPDGVKSLWLMTYEPKANDYRFWYFNNKGGLGGEWGSTWNDDTKTLTGKATDTPPRWTSGASNRFPDKNTNHAAFWMKDDSGKLLFDVEAKKTRQPEEAGKEIIAAWSKLEKADPPLPPELMVLERLVGSWDTVNVSKPSEWTPREVRTTSKVTRKWVLDGQFLQDTSEVSDGQEGFSLLTFDPQMKKYRSWWFNSEGNFSKSTGEWDAITETMSFKADLENGLVARSSLRLIDDDHHDWRVVVTDGNGKLYFDTKWTVTRRK
jgi:hypothetical protein